MLNKTVPNLLINLLNNETRKTDFEQLQYATDSKVVKDCSLQDSQAVVFGTMYTISIIFLMILPWFRKRTSLWPSCCWGKPGIPVPLNILDGYENRLGYALAFAVLVMSCYAVLLDQYAYVVGSAAAASLAKYSAYFSILFKFVLAQFIAMTGWPLFFCQTMKNRIVGSIIGLLFALIWFATGVNKLVVVNNLCISQEKGTMIVLLHLPKYVCLFLLMCKFLKTLVFTALARSKKLRKARNLSEWLAFSDKSWREGYLFRHVAKQLHSRKNDQPILAGQTRVQRMGRWVKGKLYENEPGFRYSTRVIASAVVSSTSIYFVLVELTVLLWLGFEPKKRLFGTYILLPNMSEAYRDSLLTALKASFVVAILLATLLYIAVTCHSFALYRKHITQLRRGDWSFLPGSLSKRNFFDSGPPRLMMASLKFAGAQVTYCIWGYMLNFGIFFLLVLVIAVGIIESSWLIRKITTLIPTAIMLVVLFVVRKILGKYVFLINPQTLAVDNRRCFLVFSYLNFFLNIFIGIVTSSIRLLYSMALGVVLYQRLQKSALPRSFETYDPGYMSYIGYIMVEHYHANPIMQCFVRLLRDEILDKERRNVGNYEILEHQHTRRQNLSINGNNTQLANEQIKRKRAVNRWFLCIMLAKNPSLCKFRSHALRNNLLENKNGVIVV